MAVEERKKAEAAEAEEARAQKAAAQGSTTQPLEVSMNLLSSSDVPFKVPKQKFSASEAFSTPKPIEDSIAEDLKQDHSRSSGSAGSKRSRNRHG